ncbi:MAG: transcription/translation regulatory transformer protein RfaH [Pseudohongiella sp.]
MTVQPITSHHPYTGAYEIVPAQPAWFLVQCKPRDGFRAEEHLKNQGFTCFHPTHKARRTHANRRMTRIESLFPHYLFVRIRPEQSFAAVNATRGVCKIVNFHGYPSPVPVSLVTALMRHNRILNGHQPEPEFKPGDTVTITEGAFQAIEAVVKATKGEERVILLLKLLSQERELEMATSQVRVLK